MEAQEKMLCLLHTLARAAATSDWRRQLRESQKRERPERSRDIDPED